MRNWSMPIVVVAALMLGGCAGNIVGAVAKPVLGLAVKDAQTTKRWIQDELAAGRLSLADATLARGCPDAVLALDALRAQFEGIADTTGAEGFKGLIYLGTLNRYGQSSKEQATLLLQDLIASCAPLVPADRLVLGF